MQQRVLKTLEIILFIAAVGSFLFFVPIPKILDALAEISPGPFMVSCLLYLPTTYLTALRLHILASRQGIELTRLKLFEISLIVKFYSFFSPASSLGALVRWYKLSSGGRSVEAFTTVSVNRLLDIFVAVLFGLFWAIGGIEESYLAQPFTFLVFLVIVILFWLLLTRSSPSLLDSLGSKLENDSHPWLTKGTGLLKKLASSVKTYSQLPNADLGLLLGLGLAGELLNLVAVLHVAKSLNIPISLVDLGWMRSIFFLAALTPFTLAGGLGLREVSMILTLSAFGIPAVLATAFSFAMYVRGVLVSLFGGIIQLLSFTINRFLEKT